MGKHASTENSGGSKTAEQRPAAGTVNQSTSATNTAAGAGAGARPIESKPAAGAGARTEENGIERFPAPLVVEVEPPDPPKRGRGRPPGSKTKKAAEVAQPEEIQKAAAVAALASVDLKQLIQGLFDIIAGRAGSHWKVNAAEADSIAKPLSKLLGKMKWLEKLGPYSDAIALVMAVTAVTLPRLIVSIQLNKVRKKVKSNEPDRIKPPSTGADPGPKHEQSGENKEVSGGGNSESPLNVPGSFASVLLPIS